MNSRDISQNSAYVQDIIRQAEEEYHREPHSVLLLAVSKKQSSNLIEEAYKSGLLHFGENYYQEALGKIKELHALPLYWHFIGPIQSNKAKGIATHFHWVHSINRQIIAELLNAHRPKHLPPLNICIQINLVAEDSKSGIPAIKAEPLVRAISKLPHLKLRGLMTLPPPLIKEEESYELFCQLRALMHSLNQSCNLNMDTLSMGMSDDLIPAIKAGATIVRIGRALFGSR